MEKKLTEIVTTETDSKDLEMINSKKECEKIKVEKKELEEKLNEKNKKYEELEEIYKQKLSQFKKEIMLIKTQQQSQSSKDSPDNANSNKDFQEILRRERENSNDLERKLAELTKLTEMQKMENFELKSKVQNLEKEKFNSNQKNLQFSFSNNVDKNNDSRIFSASPIQNSRVGSFVKCNFDDFEEKINNLLQENENLNNTVKESNYWKDKYQELEERASRSEEKENPSQGMSSKIR